MIFAFIGFAAAGFYIMDRLDRFILQVLRVVQWVLEIAIKIKKDD